MEQENERKPLAEILDTWLDALEADLSEYGDLEVMLSENAKEELARWGKGAPPKDFDSLIRQVAACEACEGPMIRKGAILPLPARKVRVLFFGDMPDPAALREGSAIGGETGKLLWKIISAMGLSPDEVYVGNTLFCRFPERLKPQVETSPCRDHLLGMIRFLKPEVVCCLGPYAAGALMGSIAEEGKRGTFLDVEGVPMLFTHHPSRLLEKPALKRDVWADVQKIMKKLGV